MSATFDHFAIDAIAARMGEVHAHVQSELQRSDNPDSALVDVLQQAGLTAQSSMTKVLAALVGVHGAERLYPEWVAYKWTLRSDPLVHARYFHSHEASPLFPGNYTDACFQHATLENLYDNDLWRTMRTKPAKQAGLVSLARSMLRAAAASATVAAERIERKKRLNADAGQLDASVVAAELELDRVAAATALRTIEAEWASDKQRETQHALDIREAVRSLDVPALHDILDACQAKLVALRTGMTVRTRTAQFAHDVFATNASAMLTTHMTAQALVADNRAWSDAHAASIAKHEAAYRQLEAQKPSIDNLDSVVADWMYDAYVQGSSTLVHDMFVAFSRTAAMARTSPFADIHRHVEAMARGTAAIANDIASATPVAVDVMSTLPDRLHAYLTWQMRMHAHEYVIQAFQMGIPPMGKSKKENADDRVRQAMTLNMVRAAAGVDAKGADGGGPAGHHFLVTSVKRALSPDTDHVLAFKGQTAMQLIASARKQLDHGVVPQITLLCDEAIRRFAVVPNQRDIAATRGTWRVDMAVFQAFVQRELVPGARVEQAACSGVQQMMWLVDVEQLTKASVAPTFQRVFAAARSLLLLRLAHAAAP